MKRKYQQPEVEVIKFELLSAITLTNAGEGGEDDGEDIDWSNMLSGI